MSVFKLMLLFLGGFFALDFAAVFALDGLSHLISWWQWFIPVVILAMAACFIKYALWLERYW